MATKKTVTPMPSKIRFDGWQNLMTGIGVTNRDKRMAGKMMYDKPLTEIECEDIFAGDGQARRLAEILPNEATRQWIEFNSDDLDGSQGPVHDEIKRLKIKAKVKESWINGRIYGGGGLFINTGDNPRLLETPLDENKIQRLVSFVPLTRWELQVQTTDICSNLMDENFGQPDFYRLSVRQGMSTQITYVKIHHSRIIRFDGLYLPRLRAYQNQHWGDSIYTSIHEIMRDLGMSYGGVASLMQEFRILVFKMQGLADMVDTEDLEALRVRLEAMNLSRSVIGTFMCDAEGESLESETASVAGMAELLEKLKGRLQAAVDVPHTILFNESPSGLGATGRSEETQWYDHVKSQQTTYLMPILDRIFRIMFLAKQGPTSGVLPEDWSYKFNPLWQATEAEEATTLKTKADAYGVLIDKNVLSNDEARTKMFPDLEGDAPIPAEPQEPVITPMPGVLSAAGGPNAKASGAGKE